MKLSSLAGRMSTILPPLLAEYFREFVFPFKRAIQNPEVFTRPSVTGSVFSGITSDLHCYCFAIHGFFDWRNLVIAKAISEYYSSMPKLDFIEIGANIGTETIGFGDICGERGTVHAFEPLSSNLVELKKNCALNPNLSVIIYPVALGSHEAFQSFILPPANFSGMGKIHDNIKTEEGKSISVPVYPLDKYVHEFSHVKAIFIDVEGYEPAVLAGGTNTIETVRPVIILEVSKTLLAENGYSNESIFSFFNNANYSCYNIGRVFIRKVIHGRLKHIDRHTNWICIPNESLEILDKIRQKVFSYNFKPLTKL